MSTETNTIEHEIREILGNWNTKVKEEVGTVKSVKVNLSTFITMTQLELLTKTAKDFGLEFTVKRSGLGLLIEFKTAQ